MVSCQARTDIYCTKDQFASSLMPPRIGVGKLGFSREFLFCFVQKAQRVVISQRNFTVIVTGKIFRIHIYRPGPVLRRAHAFKQQATPGVEINLVNRSVEKLYLDRRVLLVDCDNFPEISVSSPVPMPNDRICMPIGTSACMSVIRSIGGQTAF